MRWKQLEEVEKQRIEQIKKDTDEARLKLEDEMQTALYEYQAEQIRQGIFEWFCDKMRHIHFFQSFIL